MGPEVAGRLILRNTFIELEDPGTLDTGIEGPMGRARASSDGCLFESSRLEEDVPPGQEAVDLVEISLTGASCLNTPRSASFYSARHLDFAVLKNIADTDAKGVPTPVNHVANLQLQQAWSANMPKPAVKKEDLQRLSDEVAQLVKQNKQLRTQITMGKEPVAGLETQDVGASWMAYSMQGFKKWRVPSKKICEVRLCGPWPDLEAHIERYRNSSVMHHSVPEEFKPVLFENGKQIPFPKLSKAPKAPQIRRAPGPVSLAPVATHVVGSAALSPGLVQRSNF